MKLSIIIALLISGLSCYGFEGTSEEVGRRESRYAVVNLSANYMYAAPDYESGLETQLLMGTVVEVLEENRYWRKVRAFDPDYVAWTTELGLSEMDGRELRRYLAAPKYICCTELSHVHERTSTRSRRLGELVLGDILRVAEVSAAERVASAGWKKVLLPDGRCGYVQAGDVTEFEGSASRKMAGQESGSCPGKLSSRHATAKNIVATAERFLGVPYLWGGNSIKGVDCSGLVWNVYFLNGIILPRNASQQAAVGKDVPLDRLKPGDLIFFGRYSETGEPKVSHVGISTGGSHFIHSSQVVRTGSLSPKDHDYYDSKQALFARRVAGGKGLLYVTDSEWY